jgi:hypothetical protein
MHRRGHHRGHGQGARVEPVRFAHPPPPRRPLSDRQAHNTTPWRSLRVIQSGNNLLCGWRPPASTPTRSASNAAQAWAQDMGSTRSRTVR